MPSAPATLPARERLRQAREAFRIRVHERGAPEIWSTFKGRIAAVLAGGGARGAYEAGALLAVQDARVPTHLITATSIGSINGASYAAHSEGMVGNAEPLVDAWFDLTPPAVGVEWTRYTWMIGGLLATFAGIVNLTYYTLQTHGANIHLEHPALAWISLALAGTSVLLFYDQIPYLYFVVRRLLRRSRWRPSPRRLAISIAANSLVFLFALALLESLAVQGEIGQLVYGKPLLVALILAALFFLRWARRRLHPRFGRLWGALLRLPFRSGIFSNFERTRFIRGWIPAQGMRESKIRLVLTATDLETGAMRCYTNTDPSAFRGEPGVDASFAAEHLIKLDDMMPAVIASSALPIAYEPLEINGRLHADGAIVGSQPIRPAIRLGADVLLIISMESPGGSSEPVRTFVDVGLRALDILMQGNIHSDIALLTQANRQIEEAAAATGTRPEDLVIEFEGRRFRYVKAFAVKPTEPIEGTILDFGGKTTGEIILRGYLDACARIEELAMYAKGGGFNATRQVLALKIATPSASKP